MRWEQFVNDFGGKIENDNRKYLRKIEKDM